MAELQQTLATLQQVCDNQTDANAINAIQTTINHIKNHQNIRASFGNLSPNINSANDNAVSSTNVGEASASYQSPASDNSVNATELQNCAANVSPFVESPIVVTSFNNCVFNSVVVNETKAKANVNQQKINSNLMVSNLQTWMPFIQKMDEAGFTDAVEIINLLQKHEGNYAVVLKELVNVN